MKPRRFNYKFILIFLGIFLFLSFQIVIIRRITIKRSASNLSLLIISVDTLRADHMGVYGYPKNTTPNIDEWAKDAFVFTNMKTLSPVTIPSFSIMMTGESPFVSKIYTNGVTEGIVNSQISKISDDTTTLAEMLKKDEFTTAAFVTNVALWPEFTNLNKGFDSYRLIDYYQSKEKYNRFFDESIEWLEKNKDKKFFLWVHLMDPHAPYLPPEDLKCKFNPKYCDVFSKISLEKLSKEERMSIDGCQLNGLPKTAVELFEMLYDGSIASADRTIGKILDSLRDKELDKRTVVVFYGDHGEGFDHNYFFEHGKVLYDSSTRIPFIIKHPLISKGSKTNVLLQNTQIMPTLLELLQIPFDKKKFNYKSFEPLIYNDLFSKFYSGTKQPIQYVNGLLTQYAIQDNRFKYIYSLKGGSCLTNQPFEELYDLKEDPNEKYNLINKKSNIAKKLKTRLLNYLAQYGLPKPLSEIGETTAGESSSEQQKTIDKLKSLGY